MTINWKVERLARGESFITSERGNSMVPRIMSGQNHRLKPITWQECNVGNIVYCRIGRAFYTHLVKATDPNRGCQIGNNKGRINGWTKQVFGIVTEVL